MTSDEVKTNVGVMLGLLSTKMTDNVYTLAELMALTELGWTLPETDSFKCIWIIKRALRHTIDILFAQYAESVDHQGTKHSEKFFQMEELLKKYDKDFDDALDTFANKFAVVDITKCFGTYAGGSYDFSPIIRFFNRKNFHYYWNMRWL